MKGFLPDVNVLLALTLLNHVHTEAANDWYEREDRPALHVCRMTQLSFLRFLTTKATAGAEVVANDMAWNTYGELLVRGNIVLVNEPAGMDRELGEFARYGKPAPKLWADAYLGAFAINAGLRLVTFDQVLAKSFPGTIALQA